MTRAYDHIFSEIQREAFDGYRCRLCHKPFASKDRARSHCRRKHSEDKAMICAKCQQAIRPHHDRRLQPDLEAGKAEADYDEEHHAGSQPYMHIDCAKAVADALPDRAVRSELVGGRVYPLNIATVESENGKPQFVVKRCVICGDEHRHGFDHEMYREGGETHKVAHCHDGDGPGGYYLKLREDEVLQSG